MKSSFPPRFRFLKAIRASVSLLILLICTSSAEAEEAKGPVAAAGVQSMLRRSSIAALKGRYLCVYVSGVRAKPSDAPDATTVRVVVDGLGELPGTHVMAGLPSNWDVRFQRAGKGW